MVFGSYKCEKIAIDEIFGREESDWKVKITEIILDFIYEFIKKIASGNDKTKRCRRSQKYIICWKIKDIDKRHVIALNGDWRRWNDKLQK